MRSAALAAKAKDQKLQVRKVFPNTINQISIKALCLEHFKGKDEILRDSLNYFMSLFIASIFKAKSRSSSALLVHAPQGAIAPVLIPSFRAEALGRNQFRKGVRRTADGRCGSPGSLYFLPNVFPDTTGAFLSQGVDQDRARGRLRPDLNNLDPPGEHD
jgi:hypothetical protein